MSPVTARGIQWRAPYGVSHRIRCEVDPQPTKRARKAPEIRVPNAPPPPPPVPPPPPPPEDVPEVDLSSTSPLQGLELGMCVDQPKMLGLDRRFVISTLVGVPLGLVWRGYRLSRMPKERIAASVFVPKKTKEGVKTFRRDLKFITGSNGMTYLAGTDKKGRMYLIDTNGVLFYDSGIPDVGWYAVDKEGEMTNLYAENGNLKSKYVGNIRDIKEVKFDEFMGLPIKKQKWAAFRDDNIKPLPPNTPLVQSSRDKKALVPPLFIDEGEIVLDKKSFRNPFAGNDGGGEFNVMPENESS